LGEYKLVLAEKKLENSRYEMQIEVPENKIEDEYVKVYNNLQQNARIDGFRKGKVPMDIIQKRFKGTADSDVVENIIKNTYGEALEGKDVYPINQPEFDFEKIERGKAFTFTVKFDIAPTIELSNYKNISVKEKICEITDKDVTKELDILRERHATVSLKEKDEKAEKGDKVKAQILRVDEPEDKKPDNKDEGDKEKSQPVPETFSVVLYKNKSDYGFDEELLGMKTDEEKEVTKKFPKNYNIESLAGQKVKYLLKCLEVNKLTLPEPDDEFAKDLGEQSTIEELRKKMKEDMQKYVNDRAVKEVKNELIKEIIEKSVFDLPESLTVREMDRIVNNVKTNMGLGEKNIDILFQNGLLEKEKFYAQVREDAVKNIKSTLSLLEIAKKEDIKAPVDKYKEMIKSYAESNKLNTEEIEKTFEQDGTKENIETELVLGEASEFVYKNANIKKSKVSYEEMIKVENEK
jgi:trigger factor